MAGRSELLLLASLLLAGACRASELVPFIAWSNSDALSSLRTSEDVDEITLSLSKKKTELTLVFLTREFSFDDLAKYGGVFGDSSDSAFSGLKTALKKAESQYWSGVRPLDSAWILDFSHRLGEKAVFVDPSVTLETKNWHGLVIVDLSVFDDYEDKDAVVKNMMSDLENLEISFLAIYTQNSGPNEKETDLKWRSQRSADPQLRQTQPDSNDCPISSTSDCLLFCLQPPIIFAPDIDNSDKTCNLTDGSVVDNGCENNQPYLTLVFNVSTSGTATENACNRDAVSALVTNLGGNVTRPYTLTFNLKFVFTSDNSSDYYAYYFMTIDATVDLYLASAFQNSSNTLTLERQHPADLYDNFTVPLGLSYACSASGSLYNNYTGEPSPGSALDGSSLLLESIQVQPFDVQGTTFATAYNCIGYFTEATWMGIFTVIVLLIAFYLSIICAFSMQTVDRFEDPRGQTILVEKLH